MRPRTVLLMHKIHGKKCEVVSDAFRIRPDPVISVALVAKRFFNDSILEHAERAAYVADVAKCVSVVSSGFQAVALGLRLASEAKRGPVLMPQLRSKMFELVPAVGETMTRLMHPKANVHPLLSIVFEVQEKSLRIMGHI